MVEFALQQPKALVGESTAVPPLHQLVTLGGDHVAADSDSDEVAGVRGDPSSAVDRRSALASHRSSRAVSVRRSTAAASAIAGSWPASSSSRASAARTVLGVRYSLGRTGIMR